MSTMRPLADLRVYGAEGDVHVAAKRRGAPLPGTGEAALALAVVADALAQLQGRGLTGSPYERARQRQAALAWFADTESTRPFSLAWCCLALSIGTGVEFNPDAVSVALLRGTWIPRRHRMPRRVAGRGMVPALRDRPRIVSPRG